MQQSYSVGEFALLKNVAQRSWLVAIQIITKFSNVVLKSLFVLNLYLLRWVLIFASRVPFVMILRKQLMMI